MSEDKNYAGDGQPAALSLILSIKETVRDARKLAEVYLNSGDKFDARQLGDEFSTKLSQRLFHGRGYYFAFRAGASTTNIQFAELMSLVGRFSHFVTPVSDRAQMAQGVKDLQFHSTNDLGSGPIDFRLVA